MDIWVDFDNASKSDARTRATQTQSLPLGTFARALAVVLPGDVIRLVRSATEYANAGINSSTCPNLVATLGAPITVQGMAVGDLKCRMTNNFTVDGAQNWIWNDIEFGNSSVGGTSLLATYQLIGAHTWNRCDWKNGGTIIRRVVNRATSNLLYDSCTTASRITGTPTGNAGRGHYIQAYFGSDGANAANYAIGNVTFRNSDFGPIHGEDAIQFAASYGGHTGTLLVEGCTFHDCLQGDPAWAHCDAIQLLNGDNWILDRCKFINCDSGPNAFDEPVGHILWKNCLFVGKVGGGYSSQIKSCADIKIYHCTWVNSSVGGLLVNDLNVTPISYDIRNNIIDSFTIDRPSAYQNGTTRVWTDNLIGGAPLFAADNGETYGLSASSPALNAGIVASGSIPTTDFFGRTRSQPPDLGYLERGATTSPGNVVSAGYELSRFRVGLVAVGAAQTNALTLHLDRAYLRPAALGRLGAIVGEAPAPPAPSARGWVEVGAGDSSLAAIFDPIDHGAAYDGTTDDSAAIQAAIDACSRAGGGIVDISATEQIQGTTAGARVRIDSTIIVKSSVWLRGRGAVTAFVGNANPMFALPTSGVVPDRIAISDLFLQSPAGDGIQISTAGTTGGHQLGWLRLTLENITIADAVGDAFYQPNSGGVIETRYINCVSLRAGGVGFEATATDLFLMGCTAAQGVGHGFNIGGGNNKLSTCKSYGNSGTGFNIQGAGRHLITGCEAQDNIIGFDVGGSWNTVSGCLADSCRDVGFRVSGKDCVVTGAVAMYGGGGSGYATKFGFLLAYGGGDIPQRNRVDGTSGCATHVAGYTAENDVVVKASGYALQRPTFAATIVPDPYLGAVVLTLTGNLAISAPTTGAHDGQRLRFVLTQDATGARTVTFASAFRTSWTPVTTAGATNIIDFVFNGKFWQQTGATVGLTAPASVGVTDSFNRANAGTLGTADTGQTWALLSGSAAIVSNQAVGGGGGGVAVIDALAADFTLTATVVAVAGDPGIVIRATDTSNYILITNSGIVRKVAGTDIPIRTDSLGLVNGSVVRIEAYGPNITVYKDGVLKYVVGENFNVTATKHGLYMAPGDTFDALGIA
jgi:hypothetical protein